jgi:glucosylceramidase
LQRALSINPKIKLMISPWAPPEWMCVRDSEGSRRLDHKYFAVYADYLVRTLDAYAKLTPPIHIDALTSQNEPFFFTPNYPSLLLTPKEQIELIAKHLGPKLEAYNRAHASDRPKVKLFTHDHNWDLWPGVLEVLDGVGRYADAIAWHGYNGEVADYVKNVQPKYPNLPIYYTEITGIYWDKSTPQDDLLWDARNVLIGPLLAGARACLKWNIVLDGKNGPLNGGVDFLKAFLRVVSPQKIEANQEHYTMGLASKAVRPGAVRIGVKTSKDLECVAFQNPDGSRVLLAANGGDKPLLLALENGAQASLPPKSFSAVRW